MNQRIGLIEQRLDKLENIFHQEESILNEILGDNLEAMEETETNIPLNETIQTLEPIQSMEPI